MARTVSITCPSRLTEPLLSDLQQLDQIIEIQLFPAASRQPAGDVVQVTVPNRRLNHMMRLLDRRELGQPGGVSITTSEVESVISSDVSAKIERDNNEGTWEEIEMTISDDANTTPNTLLAMALAGSLAVAGLVTDSVHMVIAAMMLAPGFMAIVRVALGIIGRRKTWRYGLLDFLKGYVAMALGALVAALGFMLAGYPPEAQGASYYLVQKPLLNYWTSMSFPSLLSSVAAATAGGLLLASKRSVLTSGVMVGLALVPSLCIGAVALVAGDLALLGRAMARFGLDALIVLAAGSLVLWCSKRFQHKRDIRLD